MIKKDVKFLPESIKAFFEENMNIIKQEESIIKKTEPKFTSKIDKEIFELKLVLAEKKINNDNLRAYETFTKYKVMKNLYK